MNWTSQPSQFTGTVTGSAEFQKLIDEVGALSFDYRLNEAREYVGVVDPRVVKEWLFAFFSALGPEGAETLEVFDQMSDEQLAAIATPDVETYHTFEGISLSPVEVVEGEVEVPNPLVEGVLMEATVRIEITELVNEWGCIEVTSLAQPEQETMVAVIAEFMADLGVEATEEELAELAQSLVVETETVGHYDATTGYFERIIYSTRIAAEGEERLETTTFTDITR